MNVKKVIEEIQKCKKYMNELDTAIEKIEKCTIINETVTIKAESASDIMMMLQEYKHMLESLEVNRK